jgi:hypothetical protein
MKFSFLPVAIILGLSLTAVSQSPPSKPAAAEFRGVIVDGRSARIPKASILVEGAGNRWNLESDEGGEFNLDLPAGEYQFTIEKPDFKRLTVLDFCIMGGSKISYEFRLTLGRCSHCDEIGPEEEKPVPRKAAAFFNADLFKTLPSQRTSL